MNERAAAMLCALAVAGNGGCEDARSSSTFEQSAADAGSDAGDAVQLRASWRYRSPGVDVDIELISVVAEQSCVTTARLRVDEAAAGAQVYRLPATPCSDLRLGADGDLVLLSSPTGHDWSSEAIDVDVDRELIRMGPWHDPEREISYRFALGAPPCADDASCECPRLERRAGEQTTGLPLARDCD